MRVVFSSGGGGCKVLLAVSASYCCVMANQTLQYRQAGLWDHCTALTQSIQPRLEPLEKIYLYNSTLISGLPHWPTHHYTANSKMRNRYNSKIILMLKVFAYFIFNCKRLL